MAHTYYSRLSIVHPQDASKLDPRLGRVVAETASTGRFIMGDITWESAVAPNADSTTAFHTFGEMTIYEPLGMGLFDYIRSAAFSLDMATHLDARFLLEIEIIAEKMPEGGTPFKYIWPIMFISTELKSSLTERGTEYNIKFVHTSYHSQTDMVQSVPENTSVDGTNLEKYFENLQRALEVREYKYASSRQKAFDSSKNSKNGDPKIPEGNNPAAQDVFHDEYHFILDPEIKKWEFATEGVKDAGGSSAFGNILRSQKLWTIPMRPGTTIIQQINKVIKSTKQAIELTSPNKKNPQTAAKQSEETVRSQINKPYQFYRIETQSIYKAFDYVRGRYAVKHIFFIFLADQPNMYNYPLELDVINDPRNKEKIQERLTYYIQEGLLQKLYYYNYTGLNTDILKVDLNFNQAYVLPSFPYLSETRGFLGPGAMGPENSSTRVSPYEQLQDLSSAELRRLAVEAQTALVQARQEAAAGPPPDPRGPSARTREQTQQLQQELYRRRDEAQKKVDLINRELVKRESEKSARTQTDQPLNAINNRLDLFSALKDKFVEDIRRIGGKQKDINETMPGLRPRMEPNNIIDQIENKNDANKKTPEKIFNVLISARDLIELELEIIGDPFWFGMPNVLTMGSSSLTKIEFNSQLNEKMKEEINKRMTEIEKKIWTEKKPVWGEWGGAPQYKGSPLFYFLNQVPDSEFTNDDMLSFSANDQIVGIYMVRKVVNNFKEGKWTQKLISVRDITIPSYILPRTVTGELGFEEFRNAVTGPDVPRVADDIAKNRQQEEARREIEKQAAAAGNPIRSVSPPGTTASATIQAALDARNNELIGRDPGLPSVRNPVEYANSLVAGGASREQAYQQARETYYQEVKAYFEYQEDVSKRAYANSPLQNNNVRPYSAETIAGLAVDRSANGGLENWRVNNYANPGPSIYNNPLGVGYDKQKNSYYRYESWEDGLRAGWDYYNFSQGVQPRGQQGADRFLLPSDTPKAKELDFINRQSRNSAGSSAEIPPPVGPGGR